METLRRLFRYNVWANRRVCDLCRNLDPSLLSAAAAGSIGTAAGTLKHLVGVEDAYLAMLHGQDPTSTLGTMEAYLAHDLAWFADRSAGIGDGYLALLAERDEDFLTGAFHVPWFSFPLTARDGLAQALTHSAQHRAQVLSILGERGIAVPEMDYVHMLGEAYTAAT